jgi:alpha-L-fucosidase
MLPLPSPQQLSWHEMEMNAFVHFSINTFTDKEWGYGDESPALFNPTAIDAGQWVSTFKQTGFRGVILTCKHHDGFCLWPTELSAHSVKNSPWQSGTGDVVRLVAEACRQQGLKFGIYVSPWDRNHKDYGTPAYLDYYRAQLGELFNQYGPIFEMWFDGANGGDGYYGGARERRAIKGSKYYEWPATLEKVTELSPTIIFFSDAGPGVRWVGNEKGIAGETNWCTVTPDTLYAGKAGIESLLNTGSENGTAWVPAETNVSIRPGWFYHAREDSMVKTPEQLFDIYLTSVGRGSTLLLNVPPDRRGLIHENDVASLRGFRLLLDSVFRHDLARDAKVQTENFRGESKEYTAQNLTDGNPTTSWATDDGRLTSKIDLQWNKEQEIRFVMLQESISLGQRVRAFTVEAWQDGRWVSVGSGTTIGYKRIVRLSSPTRTSGLRISIVDSRACPVIHTLEVY